MHSFTVINAQKNWIAASIVGTNDRMKTKLCITILIILITCSKIPVYSVPDFNLPDIDGNDVRLYKILHDGPVVIIAWTLWCRPTIRELDALIPYSDELESMGIQILAISQDGSKAAPDVKPFAIDHGWAGVYIVLLDTANVIQELYDIQGIPTTTAIDQEGEIVYTWIGFGSGDEITIMDSLRVLFED